MFLLPLKALLFHLVACIADDSEHCCDLHHAACVDLHSFITRLYPAHNETYTATISRRTMGVPQTYNSKANHLTAVILHWWFKMLRHWHWLLFTSLSARLTFDTTVWHMGTKSQTKDIWNFSTQCSQFCSVSINWWRYYVNSASQVIFGSWYTKEKTD